MIINMKGEHQCSQTKVYWSTTTTHSFLYSLVAFAVHQQGCVVATETVWPAKTETFTVWPSIEKVC